MNERTIPVDSAHAERVVSDFCARAELPVPTTAAEVVELLGRLGYAVTPRTLEEFIEKRYIADPGDVWDSVSLYCLMGGLESRRRWKPAPCQHDAKKSGIRLELERLRSEGVNPPINDLDAYTLEDLLLQLTGSDNRPMREILFETIKLKLDGYEE